MTDTQALEAAYRRLGDLALAISERSVGPLWRLVVTIDGRHHGCHGATLREVIDAAHDAADRAGVPR